MALVSDWSILARCVLIGQFNTDWILIPIRLIAKSFFNFPGCEQVVHQRMRMAPLPPPTSPRCVTIVPNVSPQSPRQKRQSGMDLVELQSTVMQLNQFMGVVTQILKDQ